MRNRGNGMGVSHTGRSPPALAHLSSYRQALGDALVTAAAQFIFSLSVELKAAKQVWVSTLRMAGVLNTSIFERDIREAPGNRLIMLPG